MKIWAEKKKGEMEVLGATELAEMFDLVVRICVLDEKLAVSRNNMLPSTEPQFDTQTSA
jgi:hypothetical protein